VLTFHLQQPHEGANEVKESEVASVELIIAGGDAAELFDSVEEAFDMPVAGSIFAAFTGFIKPTAGALRLRSATAYSQ
jgi:hypothetical protein